MTPVELALFLVLAIGLGLCLIAWAAFVSRRPPELRGDWWTRFERDLLAYTEKRRISGQ